MAVLGAFALLALPALLPTAALVGLGPTTVFAVPLGGALLAALAAVGELAVGGSLLTWFVVLAIVVNVAAAVGLWRRWRGPRTHRARPGWAAATIAVVAAAAAEPLLGLKAQMVGFDATAIWMQHALFIYGGHHTLLADLKNPVYGFTNPDYPPLVPASSALTFISTGHVDFPLGVDMTAILNASALGVIGCGIAASVAGKSAAARWLGIVLGASVCLIGFGIAGMYGVNGYADLLWAASAVAAIVFGLVLARSPRHLAATWMFASVAGLTKNEGLTTAVVILVLVAIRYLPSPARRLSGHRGVQGWARLWAQRLGAALVLAVPGLSWAGVAKLDGIGNSFFSGSRPEPVLQRVGPTVSGLWAHLHLLPLAGVVLVAGGLVLAKARRTAGWGNALWLWAVLGASLAALAASYVFGSLAIAWWLYTSVERTTIFAQVVIYCELALWALVAVSNGTAVAADRQRRGQLIRRRTKARAAA